MKKAFLITYKSLTEKDIATKITTVENFFNGKAAGHPVITKEHHKSAKICNAIILAKSEADAYWKIRNKAIFYGVDMNEKIDMSEIEMIR